MQRLYEAWEEEYPYPTYPQVQIVGTKFTDLVHDGLIQASDIIDITDVIQESTLEEKMMMKSLSIPLAVCQ